jgi:hypothetical protein
MRFGVNKKCLTRPEVKRGCTLIQSPTKLTLPLHAAITSIRASLLGMMLIPTSPTDIRESIHWLDSLLTSPPQSMLQIRNRPRLADLLDCPYCGVVQYDVSSISGIIIKNCLFLLPSAPTRPASFCLSFFATSLCIPKQYQSSSPYYIPVCEVIRRLLIKH